MTFERFCDTKPGRDAQVVVAPTPVVTADWFATRIAALRRERGLTPGELAGALGRNASGIRHFESSTRLANKDYIEIVLAQLGHSQLIDPYWRVIERAKRKPLWWKGMLPRVKKSQRPSELHQLELLVNFESSAEHIHLYAPQAVPDLVQTSRYADALEEVAEPLLGELHRRLRPGRQAVLHQDEPPTLHVLLDEPVLYRAVGSGDVLREQLAALLDLTELPHVTVQVVPTGAAFAAEGNFALLDLSSELDGDPGAVFVKTAADWIHFRAEQKVDRYRSRWAALLRYAVTPERTRTMLEHTARELASV